MKKKKRKLRSAVSTSECLNKMAETDMKMPAYVRCNNLKMARVIDLKPHPKNANKHTADQIQRLSELISYHGFRHPVIVSLRSGYIVAGHARLEAAKKLGYDFVPIDYQDFPNDEAEYSFLISDNAIGEWAELDLAGINLDLPDLGPFDIELLGLRNFTIDVSELDPEAERKTLGKYALEIELPNEADLKELHEELSGRGYIVRVTNG